MRFSLPAGCSPLARRPSPRGSCSAGHPPKSASTPRKHDGTQTQSVTANLKEISPWQVQNALKTRQHSSPEPPAASAARPLSPSRRKGRAWWSRTGARRRCKQTAEHVEGDRCRSAGDHLRRVEAGRSRGGGRTGRQNLRPHRLRIQQRRRREQGDATSRDRADRSGTASSTSTCAAPSSA